MHKTILLFSGIFATILLREMSRQSAQASSYRFDIQLCCCALPSILFVQCIDFYYIRQWVGHFECQTNWVTYFALGFFIRRFYLLCCKKGRCLTTMLFGLLYCTHKYNVRIWKGQTEETRIFPCVQWLLISRFKYKNVPFQLANDLLTAISKSKYLVPWS